MKKPYFFPIVFLEKHKITFLPYVFGFIHSGSSLQKNPGGILS